MTHILLLCILVAAHTVETVTGFGSTVIALSLGVHIVPIEILVVALVLVGWLQSVWLVTRNHRKIEWSVLAKRIVPFAALGFPIGMWCSRELGRTELKTVLGGFVVLVSALELVRLFRPAAATKPLPAPLGYAVLGTGGFFHGLFATGGPLIVYYASRQLAEKAGFRVTLSALWLVLNSVLIGSFAFSGRLEARPVILAATLLPGLAGGILAGEYLHSRVNESLFRKVVQIVLFFVGIFLIV